MVFKKNLSINGLSYTVEAPSKKEHKKYDVYLGSKYLLSFGDNRYQQFKDKFGYYDNLDHGDETRRLNYRLRHRKDKIYNPYYPGYWSYRYLW